MHSVFLISFLHGLVKIVSSEIMFKSIMRNVTGVQPAKKIWTAEEDALLLSVIDQVGFTNWTLVGKHISSRTGKQCRERWCNHLHPDLKKTDWTLEEDRIIETLQGMIGNQWSKITKALPGRTDNAAKNRYHANAKVRGSLQHFTVCELEAMGITVVDNNIICSFSNPSMEKKGLAPHQQSQVQQARGVLNANGTMPVAVPIIGSDHCFKPNSLSSSPIDHTFIHLVGVDADVDETTGQLRYNSNCSDDVSTVQDEFGGPGPVSFGDFDDTAFDNVFCDELEMEMEEEEEGCMNVCSSQIKNMWATGPGFISQLICAPLVKEDIQFDDMPVRNQNSNSVYGDNFHDHEAMDI